MERDVEMELSIKEMLLAVVRHWMMVLAITLGCTLVFGGYGYFRLSRPAPADMTQEELNAKEEEEKRIVERDYAHEEYMKESYRDYWKYTKGMEKAYQEELVRLEAEIDRLNTLKAESPIYKQDPAHCDIVRLTVYFDPESGNHSAMAYDWLQALSDSDLFGEAQKELAPYRNYLIRVDDAGSADGGDAGGSNGELLIRLFEVDGFDTGRAKASIRNCIEKKAKEAGFDILGTSESRVTGYNEQVAQYQKDIDDQISSDQDRIESIYRAATTVMSEPDIEPVDEDVAGGSTAEVSTTDGDADGAETVSVSLRDLVKYILLGFVLGLFVGSALAIFLTMRQGILVSRRQIEDIFNLEMLSDCSKENHPAALDILSANLDVMVGDDGASVMLLGAENDEKLAALVKSWSEAGEGRLVAGRDIFEDSVTIDALSGVSGILLAIRIGKSRMTEVQRVLLRAHKLDKKVQGFVLI